MFTGVQHRGTKQESLSAPVFTGVIIFSSSGQGAHSLLPMPTRGARGAHGKPLSIQVLDHLSRTGTANTAEQTHTITHLFFTLQEVNLDR